MAAKDAYEFLGSPEGELAIVQACLYCATAPNSNAIYKAQKAAWKLAKETRSLIPPANIINALPGVFYLFDASGRFLRWNQPFKDVTGYGDRERAMMQGPDFFGGKYGQRSTSVRGQGYRGGKDGGLKWPAPLAVSRPKPGGLPPPVLDKIFKVDAKALPGYAGAQSPAGFAVVKVSKVIEIGEIDDAKRKSLSAQLQQAVALGELESSVGSLRESVGVQLRKETGDKKADASAK